MTHPNDTIVIPLSNGGFALVDRSDLPLVCGSTWRSGTNGRHTQYALAKIDGRDVTMHRMLTGALTGQHVDHINGNGLDNRRANLRVCTHSQNMANRPAGKGGKYGFKGVKPSGRRWLAQINRDSPQPEYCYLGTFDTIEEAARAYDAKAREWYGEFAHLNFPDS